jgi:hypothetical protein
MGNSGWGLSVTRKIDGIRAGMDGNGQEIPDVDTSGETNH